MSATTGQNPTKQRGVAVVHFIEPVGGILLPNREKPVAGQYGAKKQPPPLALRRGSGRRRAV